ncbi:MAG: CocE/NonD family hydrolase [Lentisphaeria bacterium]|nr:CocE/NonD family hydrolase [Lentisphaeria bacterium]
MANIVKECYVTMRDGVELYTVVQLPCEQGSFPVVIKRNPYLPKKMDLDALANEDTRGYAVVTQQCRGTANSSGICIAYINERNDGLDLLDWVRKQPFYNGELFLCGGSYCASVHYSYLNTNPGDIKAAVLMVQDSERYNILYRNGFFKPGLHGNWVMGMYKRNCDVKRELADDTFRTLPLAGVTQHIFGEYVPQIEEEFLHPDPADEFWNTPAGGSDYHDVLNRCSVPVLLTTGFYDIYTGGVFDMWNSLAPERRKECALIVSPFAHAWNPPMRTEPDELPDFENARMSQLCPGFEYVWFDHFRLATPLEFMEKGKIKYYTLFENAWHTAEKLENAPVGMTFSLGADRTLNRESGEPGEITYTYNPYAPASFKGGLCNNFGGMQFQDEPNSRYDIISFVSPEFDEELICDGKIETELYCKSTASDSCFYIRLSLVREGRSIGLRDDIDSLCRQENGYTPGSERKINFTFAEHSFKIQKGDRLRLDVSSSCFPHFQVHTNRIGVLALHDKAEICRNTVITGKSTIKIFVKKGDK